MNVKKGQAVTSGIVLGLMFTAFVLIVVVYFGKHC